jgi:3-hydroxybutyryl-CoA dehydrogenase
MERVGVVGAGLMGSEIALVFALAGHEVLLADRGTAEVAAGLERLRKVLEKGVSRGFYNGADADHMLSFKRKATRRRCNLLLKHAT